MCMQRIHKIISTKSSKIATCENLDPGKFSAIRYTKPKKNKWDNYVYLHLHSTYHSFGDALYWELNTWLIDCDLSKQEHVRAGSLSKSV